MKLKDMDKVEAWSNGSGGILGVGAHTVTIETVEQGETRNGNPQLELQFANENGSIRDWVVVMPQTYGKVKSLLEATGIEVVSGEWEFNPDDLKKRELVIHIGEEPDYKDPDKTRTRVQGYAPVGVPLPGEKPEGPGPSSDLPF